ncbi:hypothetical protein ACFOYW_15350 [Gryllotalpicola reticulitermitis]|uniref:Uncharacterized protein n=1 Tax=Gryllotalpicola reticulitermitis TaxID=1184153 RepID=A0ABV8QCP4_9MICO
MTPTPTPVPTADPIAVAHVIATLPPDQWQFIALAIVIVVFAVGVLIAVKL